MRKLSFIELCRQPRNAIDELFASGSKPDVKELLGREFRGYNHPPYTSLLRIRKFIKGILPDSDPVEGYNRKVKQNRLEEPWIATRAEPFGFYRVVENAPDDGHAILLNYGLSDRNPLTEPARFLRDYIVQVYEDDPSLLIGKAFISMMGREMFAGYFILEAMK